MRAAALRFMRRAVADGHGCENKEAIEKELKWKIQEMVNMGELNIESIQSRSERLEVPKGKQGGTLVALVYLPWNVEESTRKSI